ncbi:MAG: hypothetical protein PF638_05695 [Candidatus Delongbacteria bacterium]|jgi:hypothetical protein|nr:hypothetical protein [Candidatus Delongbacteria bacterium]
MNRIFNIMIIIFFVSTINIFGNDIAGSAGAFLRYGLDARSEALGRSVIADTRSTFSTYFNPATAAYVSEKSIMTGMKVLAFDRNFAYLSYLMPVNNNAGIGLGILYSGTTGIEGRDNDGNQFKEYTFNENLFYVSFGLKPKDFLTFGVNVKLLYARFPESSALEETISSLTFAFDVGATVIIPKTNNLIIGLSARNFKGKNEWNSKELWSDGQASSDYYPATYSLGVSWIPPFNEDLGFYGNLSSEEFENVHYGFGVELDQNFKENIFSIRGGTNSGDMSFGLGYEFFILKKKIIMDYSYTAEGIAEFNPHSISWRFFL